MLANYLLVSFFLVKIFYVLFFLAGILRVAVGITFDLSSLISFFLEINCLDFKAILRVIFSLN